MSLEEISYVSQIAASVAVVGSLIYLALQVRQAERNQRAIIQQGRADRTSQVSLAMAVPGMATVFRKGMAGAELTREEFDQWMLMWRAGLLSAEDSFLQHKAGLLDEEAYSSFVAGMKSYMASPGLRAVWRLTGGQFGKDYRDFVDSIIEQTSSARGADAFSEWQKLVQAESGSSKNPT